MEKKHFNCRWKSKKIKNNKYFILIEGYYWLEQVYFQTKKNVIDADIEFFENRIKQYEDLLNIKKTITYESMSIEKMENFFNKKNRTIKQAVNSAKKQNENYRYKIGRNVYVTKEGIEWITKNIFKMKYLELLEKYKMELTEEYINKGYPYDYFFGKN